MATIVVILSAFVLVVDVRRIRLDSVKEAEKLAKRTEAEARSENDVSKLNSDPETDSEEDAHDADSETDSGFDSNGDSDPESLLLEDAEEDPEGLCLAVQAVLEPFRGLWFITRGDSQNHEDYNEDVQPKLFCRIVAPHDTVKDLLEQVHDYTGGHNLGGDNDTRNLNHFNSFYKELDLLEWFECDEEDNGYDVDDADDDSDGFPNGFDVPTCQERKEIGREVHSLFAQHGEEQFSYRLEHDEGLVTTDGIGVVTASGFAVGIEASPVYWDP